MVGVGLDDKANSGMFSCRPPSVGFSFDSILNNNVTAGERDVDVQNVIFEFSTFRLMIYMYVL